MLRSLINSFKWFKLYRAGMKFNLLLLILTSTLTSSLTVKFGFYGPLPLSYTILKHDFHIYNCSC